MFACTKRIGDTISTAALISSVSAWAMEKAII